MRNVDDVTGEIIDAAIQIHIALGPGLLESTYQTVITAELRRRGLIVGPVHSKQLLTYLRLMNLQVGLLINFGAATLKEGLRRIVNGYQSSALSASPRLRVKNMTQ